MSIPAPFSRVRNSEGKLFEACLDRCIAELQNFTITESCVDSSGKHRDDLLAHSSWCSG